jgi:hypothetical protein
MLKASSKDLPCTHSVATELLAIADPHPNVLNFAPIMLPSSSTCIIANVKHEETKIRNGALNGYNILSLKNQASAFLFIHVVPSENLHRWGSVVAFLLGHPPLFVTSSHPHKLALPQDLSPHLDPTCQMIRRFVDYRSDQPPARTGRLSTQ